MLPDDGRGISRNVVHLNILVYDVINLLYCKYWTDKQKHFYVWSFYKVSQTIPHDLRIDYMPEIQR